MIVLYQQPSRLGKKVFFMSADIKSQFNISEVNICVWAFSCILGTLIIWSPYSDPDGP